MSRMINTLHNMHLMLMTYCPPPPHIYTHNQPELFVFKCHLKHIKTSHF